MAGRVMAKQESRLSRTLDRMKHEVTLVLSPYGGRVFVENADLKRVDQSTIEFKCWFSPDLFGLDVTIGSEEHPRVTHYEDEEADGGEDKSVERETGWRLGDVPVMLTLYRVDEAWLQQSAANNDGSPVLGRFDYYTPANTSSGVVNDKRPTVEAWTCLGADNFALVRERLLDFKKYDFQIGLNVAFPQGTVESHGLLGRSIKWDGESELPVLSASIIWKKEDWSSDFHRKEQLFEKKPSKAELPYDPPREHIEVMDATRRIETALGRLVTPLWLAVGALIVMALFRR
jgi:hypothetical protein